MRHRPARRTAFAGQCASSSKRSATAGNTGLQLNLALNYGGRAEIGGCRQRDPARVGRRASLRHIDEEAISARLYTAGQPDPDLLIRTSGEMRLSNFLLWQIAYAELYVTETLWPDFRRTDLLQAILEYQKRDRRFGGVKADVPAPAESLPEPVGVPIR